MKGASIPFNSRGEKHPSYIHKVEQLPEEKLAEQNVHNESQNNLENKIRIIAHTSKSRQEMLEELDSNNSLIWEREKKKKPYLILAVINT